MLHLTMMFCALMAAAPDEAAPLPPPSAVERPARSVDEEQPRKRVKKRAPPEPEHFSAGIAAAGVGVTTGALVLALLASAGVGALTALPGAWTHVTLSPMSALLLGGPVALVGIAVAALAGSIAGALLEWRLGNRGLLPILARALAPVVAAVVLAAVGLVVVTMGGAILSAIVSVMAQSDYRIATAPRALVMGGSALAAAVGFGAMALAAGLGAVATYAGISSLQGSLTPSSKE